MVTMTSLTDHVETTAIVLIFVSGWTLASDSHLLQRLRTSFNSSDSNSTNIDGSRKLVPDSKMKRFDRLTVPLGRNLFLQHPAPYGFGFASPLWKTSAKIVGVNPDAETIADGMITFQPLPYTHEIKVTINMTGMPAGKHALHIHTYGDVSDNCKLTGGQFPNNFLGNIDTKDDGSISTAFITVYLNMFGFHGIVGRSIVIHSKPIDLNTALNADIFSSFLPDAIAYQNEENSVGPAIACGVISITSSTPQMT